MPEIAEDDVVADPEIQSGTNDNRGKISGDVVNPKESNEDFHEKKILGNRNQPDGQIESSQTAWSRAPRPFFSIRPCPLLMPGKVVQHGRFDSDSGCSQIVDVKDSQGRQN